MAGKGKELRETIIMVDNKKRPGKDLDRIDRNILNELQKDGRISNVELSKRVGLSPTPCLERVRRLERQGFILGYTAQLNPHYLDASLLVFVEITLNRGAPDVFEQFNAAVQKLEETQECHLVSGDFDYLLKTRVPDMSAYRSPTPITPPSAASSGQGISGKKLRIPKGEFGLTEMLAVIETRAMARIPPPPPPLDEIDQLLFGPKLDIESVHPHLRDIYAPTIKKMAELDSVSVFALPRACCIE